MYKLGGLVEGQQKKLAVLIDADNASLATIHLVLEEVAKFGVASVKRIYGDWSSETLKNWRDVLLPNAITPVQQFAYTTGKDATDMGLIIDAMDLLYSGALDGFCIVSSDSDFTPLASRIRESGLLVFGFGRRQTKEPFVRSCDKFIYVENLISESDVKIKDDEELPVVTKKHALGISKSIENKEIVKVKEVISSVTEVIDRATLTLIYKAVKENADDNGWANLSLVGQYMSAVKPDFDSRNYGRAKLSGFIKTLNLFETKVENSQMFLKKMKRAN